MTRRTGDGRDDRRFLERHRQTQHKLQVVPSYEYLWAVILAQAGQGRVRQDYFIVETHGGTGQHESIERGKVYGTVPMACSVARYVQLRVPTARVHVRAVEEGRSNARLLEANVAPFKNAGLDVKVIHADWRNVIDALADEVDGYQAPVFWLIDPFGIQIEYRLLAPLRRRRFGQEVVINLDASGAFRVNGASPAEPDAPADLHEMIFGPYTHQVALGALWGSPDWFDVVRREGRTLREKLDGFAAAYAARWQGYYQFATPYRLRSSHNQIRYLIHLANHPRGRDRFAEVFKTYEDDGLLVSGRLDEVAAHHAAREYHERFRGTTTTVDQLFAEAHRPYTKRELGVIAAASVSGGFGVYNPIAGTVRWYDEQRDLSKFDFGESAG
jgi:three-Cys-motif partner protein